MQGITQSLAPTYMKLSNIKLQFNMTAVFLVKNSEDTCLEYPLVWFLFRDIIFE